MPTSPSSPARTRATPAADDAVALELPDVLQFMQLLWAVVHGLEKTSKKMRGAIGVTGPQRLVLRVVGLFPGLSAGDLANILHIHPSTLTGVLQRLVTQRVAGASGRSPRPPPRNPAADAGRHTRQRRPSGHRRIRRREGVGGDRQRATGMRRAAYSNGSRDISTSPPASRCCAEWRRPPQTRRPRHARAVQPRRERSRDERRRLRRRLVESRSAPRSRLASK